MTGKAKADQDLLLKVYGSSLDEYRFNVQLSWDRTKFFLLLSSSLIAAGVGLLRLAQDSPEVSFFLAVFFLLSLYTNVLGYNTIALGKQYYREAVFTKTTIERELGLLRSIRLPTDARSNLSIAVTDGQRDFVNILYRSGKPGVKGWWPATITANSEWIFWLMGAVNWLGFELALYNVLHWVLH